MRDNQQNGESVKRIRRVIFNGLTLLSMLLYIAVAGLWIEGYFGVIGYRFRSNSSLRTIHTVRDGFQCDHFFMDNNTPIYGTYYKQGWWQTTRAKHNIAPTSRFVFRIASPEDGNHEHTEAVFVPAYMILLPFSILPAIWIRSRFADSRGRKRIQANRCNSCGYDLRATQNRCPECGTIPEKLKA